MLNDSYNYIQFKRWHKGKIDSQICEKSWLNCTDGSSKRSRIHLCPQILFRVVNTHRRILWIVTTTSVFS